MSFIDDSGKPRCVRCGKTGECSGEEIGGHDAFVYWFTFKCAFCGLELQESQQGTTVGCMDSPAYCPYCRTEGSRHK